MRSLGQSSHDGISVIRRDQSPFSLCHVRIQPKEGRHQGPDHAGTLTRLLQSPELRNKCLFFKLSSLWCSVLMSFSPRALHPPGRNGEVIYGVRPGLPKFYDNQSLIWTWITKSVSTQMSWTLGWTKQGSFLLSAPEEIPCQRERRKTRFQGTVPRVGNQAVYQFQATKM